MANRTFTVARSDLFPVGTLVKVFKRFQDRRRAGSHPAGPEITNATVDAQGRVTFTAAEGIYELWAEVSSVGTSCWADNEVYAPTPGKGLLFARGQVLSGVPASGVEPAPLAERIVARRVTLGC